MARSAPDLDLAAGERDEPRILLPVVVLFWAANIAVTTVQVYVTMPAGAPHLTLWDLARGMLPGYVVWFLSVPLIIRVLSRRFPFDRGRWRVALPVHLLAGVGIGAATQAAEAAVAAIRYPDRSFLVVFSSIARVWILWAVFTYWFFLAVVLAVRHYTAAAARELRATQLEAAVTNAQLSTLETQLQPHFLFNALNSISSLVPDEPRTAQRMIAQLGELLRASLSESGRASWTLRQEMELLDRYTAIEKLRFGDRLHVQVDAPPDVLDARVPALLLQPLVENAIRHGIQRSVRGGIVRVQAWRDGRWLAVTVTDDGVGLSGEPTVGLGLSNTRERLEKQFAGEHAFRIERQEPAGTKVTVRIPWSTEAVEESSAAAP